MIIQTTEIPADFLRFHREIPHLASPSLVFMDIETLGLSRRRDPIILIGAMHLGDEGGFMNQYFAQSLSDEKEILQALIQSLPIDCPLITYNGRSFDIPYINHRLGVHGISYRIPPGQGIDLMYWAKNALPAAPRHTLKAVEAAMGIHREDILSGAECVEQYVRYLKTKDPELAIDICRHNYEDILHMAPLLQLYPLLPAGSVLRELPFYLTIEQRNFWIETHTFKNGFLSLEGSADREVPRDAINYTGSASLQIVKRKLSASLPVIEFMYPAPGSLFIDCDRIPGFEAQPFNSLTLEEKMGLLVREGGQYLPEAMERHINRLITQSR